MVNSVLSVIWCFIALNWAAMCSTDYMLCTVQTAQGGIFKFFELLKSNVFCHTFIIVTLATVAKSKSCWSTIQIYVNRKSITSHSLFCLTIPKYFPMDIPTIIMMIIDEWSFPGVIIAIIISSNFFFLKSTKITWFFFNFTRKEMFKLWKEVLTANLLNEWIELQSNNNFFQQLYYCT